MNCEVCEKVAIVEAGGQHFCSIHWPEAKHLWDISIRDDNPRASFREITELLKQEKRLGMPWAK